MGKLQSFTKGDAFDLQSGGSVPYTRDGGQEKLGRSCQKHESLSLINLLFTGRHLFVSFVTSL
jgi:hypothetical protein